MTPEQEEEQDIEQERAIEIVDLDEDEAEQAIRDIVYDRNRELYDPDTVPRAHIVGCGGIGAWAAHAIAMAGCRDIHLYDDDILELHNLNRLPFTRDDVGRMKTDVVRDWIQQVRPDAEVHVHGRVDDEDDLHVDGDEDRIVIAVDSAEANNAIVQAVDDTCTVVRAAYDGDRFTVHDAQEQFANDDDGYGVDPSYVAPPMMAAGLIVEKLYRDEALELFSTKLSDLGDDV